MRRLQTLTALAIFAASIVSPTVAQTALAEGARSPRWINPEAAHLFVTVEDQPSAQSPSQITGRPGEEVLLRIQLPSEGKYATGKIRFKQYGDQCFSGLTVPNLAKGGSKAAVTFKATSSKKRDSKFLLSGSCPPDWNGKPIEYSFLIGDNDDRDDMSITTRVWSGSKRILELETRVVVDRTPVASITGPDTIKTYVSSPGSKTSCFFFEVENLGYFPSVEPTGMTVRLTPKEGTQITDFSDFIIYVWDDGATPGEEEIARPLYCGANGTAHVVFDPHEIEVLKKYKMLVYVPATQNGDLVNGERPGFTMEILPTVSIKNDGKGPVETTYEGFLECLVELNP